MKLKNDEYLYRHELKYLISSAQLPVLKSRIEGIMRLDPHIMSTGQYNIRSLYFDDYDNRCFYENENGNDHRAKYRIRIYNQSVDRISLELKRKDKGKTHKDSCLLTKEQAECLIYGRCVPNLSEQPKILQGMCADILINKMHPAVIVDYDRIPYIYKDGNVRITFDTNISSSNAFNAFFDFNLPKRPVLAAGMQLMEVKFDEFLPDTIYRGLQIENLQQTAFSKYYLCRRFTL